MKPLEIVKGLENSKTIKIKNAFENTLVEAYFSSTVLKVYLLRRSEWIYVTAYFLYEPETGLFLCKMYYTDSTACRKGEYVSQLESHIKDNFFAFSKTELTSFVINERFMWITNSNKRYSSFDDAYTHFFSDLEQRLKADPDYYFMPKTKELQLSKHMNNKFFRIQCDDVLGKSYLIRPAIVSNVEYHDSHWYVELEGNDNRGIPYMGIPDYEKIPRIKAVVVLDNDYNVVDVIAEDFLKKIV
ncbi:hypothetical protein [Candidatus Albibeggiatoa sp. nov. NOAA]|uniref:hypothetical protein n=1 Tax=Candidatus Albibeggiatoa sp. nov. NOAA TaxID=3162724 RepID=UPI003300FFCB|nr:hypothetical protein [Thiotrichaceae bacterium]